MVDWEMVARQAEQRKEDGNACFKKDRLGAAIDAYTEAIALCPDVSVYWTNRALCYRKRKEWDRVEEDCRKALQIDGNSLKAHYMLGLALIERNDFVEGTKELEKVLDLAKRTALICSNKSDEILQIINKAKYLQWEKSYTERSWRLQNLKDSCENALREYHFLDGGLEQTLIDLSDQLKLLDEVFNKALDADVPSDVPDYLCCKITFEIFSDPVITPSGITYERTALLEHLRKVGKFDPVTREPLKEWQLVPNLGLKEAVQAYLNEHGWAYKLN